MLGVGAGCRVSGARSQFRISSSPLVTREIAAGPPMAGVSDCGSPVDSIGVQKPDRWSDPHRTRNRTSAPDLCY
jgi:hypothetical protein